MSSWDQNAVSIVVATKAKIVRIVFHAVAKINALKLNVNAGKTHIIASKIIVTANAIKKIIISISKSH